MFEGLVARLGLVRVYQEVYGRIKGPSIFANGLGSFGLFKGEFKEDVRVNDCDMPVPGPITLLVPGDLRVIKWVDLTGKPVRVSNEPALQPPK